MKKTLFSSFVTDMKRFFHRLYLWTKPSYRRHRTGFQKQFDIKLQYTFFGCLIGIFLVSVLIYFAPSVEHPAEPEDFIPEQAPISEDNEMVPAIQLTDEKITTLSLTLKKRETLSGLLKRADLSMAQTLEVAKALDIVFDVRKLRPGQTFDLFFLEKDNEFQGLKLETNKGETISVFKNSRGEFIPQAKDGVIENKRFALQGTVESTFSEAAEKVGIPKAVVQQVILALDGQIDFRKDLKTGETFKVIYEQKMTDKGKEVGKAQLLYISLTTLKDTYQRYFFIDGMGMRGFYNENGASTPQTLMKRPLGRGRISSKFGMRKHPILGYQIQHAGIDYPAPTGTPIPAGADGIIQKIGRNGGYGKYILIKHNNTYSTAYGHLNGYQNDLKVGSYVKKGEIIGFVGSTGRSTGPHLHYEVLKNGRAVNPLNTYTIPKRELKNQTLTEFKKKKADIDALWKAP